VRFEFPRKHDNDIDIASVKAVKRHRCDAVTRIALGVASPTLAPRATQADNRHARS
jgi:hypothetical protein